MPSTTAARPAPTRRRLMAAAALLCAFLLLAGLRATAANGEVVGGHTIVSPSEGATLEGPFEIVVRVQIEDGENAKQVDARLTGPSQREVPLAADPEPDADGGLLWRATVDPLSGLALANGTHLMEVQDAPIVGEPSGFSGHEVTLTVPPPQRALDAEPSPDDARTVVLAWESVALPDFIAYRVQRRAHASNGQWTTVHDLSDPRTTGVVDEVPEVGEYRYRLIVVRSDGDGGEVFAASDPQGVRADPEDPGTFAAPPEPRPRPSSTPSPVPTPTEDDLTDPQPTEQPTTATPDSSGPVTVQPPSTTTGGGPAAAPPMAPPAVVPFDDGVFDEVLPFEETESTIIMRETETEFIEGSTREGGTLAVLTEEPLDRGWATAAATGLLFIVAGLHVRRFMSVGRGR